MPPKAETLSTDHLFSINAGTPDMVNLTTLDEESMVSNLQERFKAGLPYTLCGQICVSVNPFRWLPIYEESVITRYHNSSNPFVTQPPHVYPVAHAALTRLQNGSTSSQSILVSGESGAGKTEATKICMQYLAKVDAMASGSASARAKALTDRVLQSSPILEAFGNAQTVRNDNSSRFGKFLQLRYSDSVRQMGANIRTYLLERSRVVRPPHKEKNYHVLYALVGGATPEETQQLGLLPEDQYEVLAEGNGRVPQKAREEEWHGVLEALSDIGFNNEECAALVRALGAVLALTLLKFDGKDGDEGNRCAEPRDPATLARAASCLQVDAEQMLQPLNSRRTYLMTGEMYVKQLDEVQAADAADALAKAVYGRMFDAVVKRINTLLDCAAPGGESVAASPMASTPGTSRSPAATAGAPPKEAPFIGILDIFGFESFETNSFEQICINYANEVLQQQFNSDVFKQQQAEYEAEGVPWTNVDFEDNSQVLLLLEAKQVGAFALLDEESRLQSGSAAAFVEKLRKAQLQNPLFSVPKLALKSGGPAFTVKHYAGPVTYDTSHFLNKNTDPLHPELCEAMEESKCDFVAALFAPSFGAKEGEKKVKKERKGSALYTQTIGSRFKEQLKDLMQLIGSTQVHYIRCVKPNAGASSEVFDSELVADQLRFAGMQEAVRISRAAFPHRLPRKEFLLRFGPLRAGTDVRDDAQLPSLLAALLQPDAFCLGKTKVFMRGSTLPDLEDQRLDLCTRRVVQLQAAWRGLGARRYRAAAAAAVLRIECAARRGRARRAAATRRGAGGRIRRVWRGALARRLCIALRTSRAATRIQAAQRRHRLDRPYAARKRAAVRVQAAGRARLARSRCTKMAEEKKVQATYEYQLNEARTRLQAEADEKSALAAEKAKLETALRERAQDDGKAAERLEEELAQRRQHSEETARLLQQQQEEVLALRKQLEASEISLKAEQGAKAGAERRAEQAQLSLSMERSEHLKLQRLLDHEKAAAAAAKAREKEARHALREMGGDANAGGGGGAELRASGSEVGGGGGGASSTKASGEVQAAQAAQQDAQERESQLKTKLAHAANESARARDKLRAMQDSLRVKQREWDKDRTNLQRQVDNLQADLAKREQWLGKAKDIITEYQKRSGPGGPGGTPGK